MKLRSMIAACLAALACGVGMQAFASAPLLFGASHYLPSSEEASQLTAQEHRVVAEARAYWRIMRVQVTEFDRSVLRAPAIVLELPDHRLYRFNGAARPERGTPGFFTWSGVLQPSTEAPLDATMDRSLAPGTLDLNFYKDRPDVYGSLRIGDARWGVQLLNPKFLLLTEAGLNPNAPPIDAEPAGPRPERPPRKGRDWPPGQLTEALRASISTSSIGRSLEPGYCNEVTSCGAVTRISCHPETDGPEMFFDNKTGALIMACGGTCMGGSGLPGSKRCTACPPPEWSSCQAQKR